MRTRPYCRAGIVISILPTALCPPWAVVPQGKDRNTLAAPRDAACAFPGVVPKGCSSPSVSNSLSLPSQEPRPVLGQLWSSPVSREPISLGCLFRLFVGSFSALLPGGRKALDELPYPTMITMAKWTGPGREHHPGNPALLLQSWRETPWKYKSTSRFTLSAVFLYFPWWHKARNKMILT